jgi:hypothetical protein
VQQPFRLGHVVDIDRTSGDMLLGAIVGVGLPTTASVLQQSSLPQRSFLGEGVSCPALLAGWRQHAQRCRAFTNKLMKCLEQKGFGRNPCDMRRRPACRTDGVKSFEQFVSHFFPQFRSIKLEIP